MTGVNIGSDISPMPPLIFTGAVKVRNLAVEALWFRYGTAYLNEAYI